MMINDHGDEEEDGDNDFDHGGDEVKCELMNHLTSTLLWISGFEGFLSMVDTFGTVDNGVVIFGTFVL